MLTALLGTPQIQDDLVRLVLDKAEGVPFFIEELVTSLRETGAIALHDGQWRLTSRGPAVPVPDTVEEVLDVYAAPGAGTPPGTGTRRALLCPATHGGGRLAPWPGVDL
jgi:hypothetical protein